ncbi:MAG: hypothetical protein GIW98_06630 [Candidatus Eremiobacteraeota bacterium]|nr:hypothetical protein [Candidatus Eremiobacteraeota bacterium]
MNAYRLEAAALDEAVLGHIAAWHQNGTRMTDDRFNALALRIFAHQLRYNQPYARYCNALGIDGERVPQHWTSIPALPSGAFKEAALATFPVERATLRFVTSGTTRERKGSHHMENSALYDAALLASFDREMLYDQAELRYLNLLPDPTEAPRSSLAYMMRKISQERGSAQSGWYVHQDTLLLDQLIRDLHDAARRHQVVCLAGTAFAFVHLLDELARKEMTLQLLPGSRIMETGGFKGRSRVVTRETLYQRLSESLGIAPQNIVAEYGMTELTSQYYDNAQSRASTRRVKSGAPWMRTLVTGGGGGRCLPGEAGALTHFDLANRSSVIAISTEDIGVATDDGFVLIGREIDAEPRGCSLHAEDLQRA